MTHQIFQRALAFILLSAGTAALFATPSSSPAAAADNALVSSTVAAAIADVGRPPWDRERDRYSNPSAVLTAVGLKPGMSVAELMPDGGYYTRIVSRAVGAQGHVYTVVPFMAISGNPPPDRTGPPVQDPGQNKKYTRVELAQSIENVPFYKNVTVFWESIAQYDGNFAVPEQVDMVLTDGDYHAFHGKEFQNIAPPWKPLDMVAVNRAILRSLKPRGVYIVIDHAAKKGSGFAQADTLHRSDAIAVRAEVLKAGFEFDGEMPVAAVPSDDHSKPVDRMHPYPTDDFVLRFRKPANAIADNRPSQDAVKGYFGNTSIGAPGARGNVTNLRERRVFYNADHTYQEFGAPNTGNNPFLTGTWFWDSAGHNCMLHEYPIDMRSLVVCHDFELNRKPGDKWVHTNDGQPNRHNNPTELVPGHQYFEPEPRTN